MLAGLLLLYRRTVTLGILVAAAVFMNVLMQGSYVIASLMHQILLQAVMGITSLSLSLYIISELNYNSLFIKIVSDPPRSSPFFDLLKFTTSMYNIETGQKFGLHFDCFD